MIKNLYMGVLYKSRNMLFTEWNLDDAIEVAREEAMEDGVAMGEARLGEVHATLLLALQRTPKRVFLQAII